MALATATLQKEYSSKVDELQSAAGVDDEILAQIEDLQRRKVEGRYSRRAVEEVRPKANLEDLVQSGLDNLLPLAQPDWLDNERKKKHRLNHDYLGLPFSLAGGVHIASFYDPPHRFAHMLLASEDFLAGEEWFDFYEGCVLLGEVATLGNNVAEIASLGSQGVAKLNSLAATNSPEVPSRVHELLVGAAFVREGVQVELVPVNPPEKSPDIRLRHPSS